MTDALNLAVVTLLDGECVDFARSARTAAKRHRAQPDVVAWRRVRDAKRTVNAAAILEPPELRASMAVLAVVLAPAAAYEERLRAAEHALPSDVVGAVLRTILVSDAERLQLAPRAEEVFTRLAFHELHLLLAVDQAAEVRPEAVAALVERAPVQRVVEFSIVIEVTGCHESFLFVQAKFARLVERLLLDKGFQFD